MHWQKRQQNLFTEVKIFFQKMPEKNAIMAGPTFPWSHITLNSALIRFIFFIFSGTASTYNLKTCLFFFSVDAVSKALLATHVLFGASLDNVKGKELIDAFAHDSRMVSLSRDQVAKMSLDRIAVESGLCSSKCKWLYSKIDEKNGRFVNEEKHRFCIVSVQCIPFLVLMTFFFLFF